MGLLSPSNLELLFVVIKLQKELLSSPGPVKSLLGVMIQRRLFLPQMGQEAKEVMAIGVV